MIRSSSWFDGPGGHVAEIYTTCVVRTREKNRYPAARRCANGGRAAGVGLPTTLIASRPTIGTPPRLNRGCGDGLACPKPPKSCYYPPRRACRAPSQTLHLAPHNMNNQQ